MANLVWSANRVPHVPTFGFLELEPTLEVVMFETLHDCAQEDSGTRNNAGTGDAANCELDFPLVRGRHARSAED